MGQETNNKPGAPEAPQGDVFSSELNDLSRSLGKELPPLPGNANQKQLEESERALSGDVMVENFSELFRINEIQNRRAALQREGSIKNEKSVKTNREELIAAEQGATYHEYFPAIIHDMTETMQRYESLRATMPTVSQDLRNKERQTRLYMRSLSEALRERTLFGNALLIESRLSKNDAKTPALMKARDRVLKDPLLQQSLPALEGNTDAKWRRGNALNQNIIDILSGKERVPGVEKGFSPQQIYLQLLKEKYEELLAEEKRLTKDVGLGQSVRRHAQLEKKNDAAKREKGDPLTPAEISEYEALQRGIADRNGELEGLSKRRREITQEMVAVTGRLGSDQLDRAELVTIQHQFGNQFDLDGVSPPKTLQTPDDIRKKMGEQMEERSEFHLLRMDAYLVRMENDVLQTGMREWVENLSNKKGREALRSANQMLTRLITSVLPETFGIKEAAQKSLTGPLDDALGWPPGKDKWEDLTSKEQQKVLDTSKSILDLVRSFDRSKINDLRGTVSLIRGMPEASTFAEEEVTEPLPNERVTEANRAALMKEFGGATVYMMLFKQMDEDWGSEKTGKGYLGEFSKFMTGVNKNVDVHLDVGDAVFRLQNSYDKMRWALIYAALAGLAAGAIGMLALLKGGRIAGRMAWKTVRFGGRMTIEGAKLGGRVTAETSRKLMELLEKSPRAAAQGGKAVQGVKTAATTAEKVVEATGKGATAGEKAAEGVAKASRLGKIMHFLTPLGVIISAFDLSRVIRRDARLEEIPEWPRVEAALELMMKHGNKKAERYETDITYLKNRLESMSIERNMQILTAKLHTSYPGDPEAQALVERCDAMQRYAKHHKDDFEKLFPVTDYLMTDPKHDKGNVGFNVRDIDDARARGKDYESWKNTPKLSSTKSKRADLLSALSKGPGDKMTGSELGKVLDDMQKEKGSRKPDPKENFEDFLRMHEDLLVDAANFVKKHSK